MKAKKSLIMLCPEKLLAEQRDYPLPEGYVVATYEESDCREYLQLLAKEGWTLTEDVFEQFLHKVLPGGLFLVKDINTGEIAATAASLHNPESSHYTFPYGSEIGFVVTHPDHRNKGLGLLVSSLAARRLISAGYQSIRIVTNDERLAALKIYIKLGFVPFLYADRMNVRWDKIYRRVGIEADSSKWISPNESKL